MIFDGGMEVKEFELPCEFEDNIVATSGHLIYPESRHSLEESQVFNVSFPLSSDSNHQKRSTLKTLDSYLTRPLKVAPMKHRESEGSHVARFCMTRSIAAGGILR